MDKAGFIAFAKHKEQEAKDWHCGPANEKSKKKLKKMYVKQLLMNKESGVPITVGRSLNIVLSAGLDFQPKWKIFTRAMGMSMLYCKPIRWLCPHSIVQITNGL